VWVVAAGADMNPSSAVDRHADVAEVAAEQAFLPLERVVGVCLRF